MFSRQQETLSMRHLRGKVWRTFSYTLQIARIYHWVLSRQQSVAAWQTGDEYRPTA